MFVQMFLWLLLAALSCPPRTRRQQITYSNHHRPDEIRRRNKNRWTSCKFDNKMSLRRLHSRSINHIDNGTHAEHSRSKKFTNKNNPRWMRSLLQNVPLIYGVTCGTGSSDAVSFILLSAGMERIVCECDCGRQSPPLSLTHLKSKKLS